MQPSASRLDGRLALTTPEGVRLLLTPAGASPRARAWAIDFLLWLLTFLFVAWGMAMVISSQALGRGLLLLYLFCSYWGYPILFEVYGGGRTPGKSLLGLRVVRADGLPVGWRESTVRNLLLVADFLPFFYTTGLLCMLLDARFRRLGDLAAGTLVIYDERAVRRPAPPAVEPLPLPRPLTPAEQSLLLDLCERETRLPPARVLELATLAEPLTGCQGQASLERLRGYAAGLLR